MVGERQEEKQALISALWGVHSNVTSSHRTSELIKNLVKQQHPESRAAFTLSLTSRESNAVGEGRRAKHLHLFPAVCREKQVHGVIFHLPLLFQVRTQKFANFS